MYDITKLTNANNMRRSKENSVVLQVAARWDFLLVELEEPLPVDGKTIKVATLDDQPNLPIGVDVGYAGYGTDEHGVSFI